VLVSGSEPATLDLVQNQPAPDDWQTLPLGPGADSPRPAVAELVRLTAPGEGSTYPLYAGDNQIGTKGAQDVRLDDQTISNPHALIICHDRESREPARIIDLKSRNGTFVGGERVSRAELNEDCLIRLADIEFRFRRLG
jgi:pSer/pThr/pTyr-binding forkhead associated (FHA) protein